MPKHEWLHTITTCYSPANAKFTPWNHPKRVTEIHPFVLYTNSRRHAIIYRILITLVFKEF